MKNEKALTRGSRLFHGQLQLLAVMALANTLKRSHLHHFRVVLVAQRTAKRILLGLVLETMTLAWLK